MEPIIDHPDLPFTVEMDIVPNRYVKRFADGSIEVATSTDYMLAVLCQRVSALEAVLKAVKEEPVKEKEVAKPHRSKTDGKDS